MAPLLAESEFGALVAESALVTHVARSAVASVRFLSERVRARSVAPRRRDVGAARRRIVTSTSDHDGTCGHQSVRMPNQRETLALRAPTCRARRGAQSASARRRAFDVTGLI